MTGPVERLTGDALATRDRETLLEAFVAAARLGVDLELPFAAAEQLGVDPATLVSEALDHLYDDEADVLRSYAEQRP